MTHWCVCGSFTYVNKVKNRQFRVFTYRFGELWSSWSPPHRHCCFVLKISDFTIYFVKVRILYYLSEKCASGRRKHLTGQIRLSSPNAPKWNVYIHYKSRSVNKVIITCPLRVKEDVRCLKHRTQLLCSHFTPTVNVV